MRAAAFFMNHSTTLMKYLSTLLLLFLLQSAFAQSNNQSDTSIQNLLRHYVTALAHDSMQGRKTGSSGMYKAAAFIANEMKAAGLKTAAGNDGYAQLFTADGLSAVNVMGVLEGQELKDEVVIICAHYDHIGLSENKKDSIYNGANDNASGTAALLFLAAQLKKLQPKRTLIFIAFSGEEMGLLGSKYVASIVDPVKIKAVINFEMLGIPSGKRAFITGANYGNFFSVLNKELAKKDLQKYGKYFFRRAPEDIRMLFTRSDNYPFALKGIPAHTIYVTDDENKHYHKESDEAHTLNYSFMTEVVEAAFIAIQPIVNGEVELKKIVVRPGRY